ncbi:hypothetical protein NDU88_000822 [Pleurodeles waltl]|uniref:Uncharacterized protein n=1 Tax=Pleurodeles waltl TaxID=8319 RepID=A0AAV7S834_PLEWA|nr:hypothetical protein NDU88_000822 [Pleurodeles waltl]
MNLTELVMGSASRQIESDVDEAHLPLNHLQALTSARMEHNSPFAEAERRAARLMRLFIHRFMHCDRAAILPAHRRDPLEDRRCDRGFYAQAAASGSHKPFVIAQSEINLCEQLQAPRGTIRS